jgi:hypothetical protein
MSSGQLRTWCIPDQLGLQKEIVAQNKTKMTTKSSNFKNVTYIKP